MVLASTLLFPATRDAQAFCRTTTCDTTRQDCSVDENGCARAGTPLTWRALPIAYRFHARSSEKLDRDAVREAVRSAFQRWSDVTCAKGQRTSLRFREGEDIDEDRPMDPAAKGADHLGIFFRDDGFKASSSPDHTLALTTHTFGLVNGKVDYADIEVNTSVATFATSEAEPGIDLQAVITHEVGHYIGLAHSLVPESIMVHDYCQSAIRCGNSKSDARKLSDDDRFAVCALFPPSGPSGVRYEAPTAPSCAATPPAPAPLGAHLATWLPLGTLTFLVAALRRRLRNRG